MKIIFCPNCTDFYNLRHETKSCSCGATSGKYTDDLNADVFGENAIVLGIDNTSFVKAAKDFIQNKPNRGKNFDAFVIGLSAGTVKRFSK